MNKVQVLVSPKNQPYRQCTKKECLLNVSDQLLKVQNSPNYTLKESSEYLEKNNYLSEFKTPEQQLTVRKNLGIDGLSYWGKIEGYIENQQDLVQYVSQSVDAVDDRVDRTNIKIDQIVAESNVQLSTKVTKEIDTGTTASEQIKYEIKDQNFRLNEQYNEAIAHLGEIKSIDDAIAVIMRSLFPINFITWSIELSDDITKSYTFEKGSTLNINGEDSIGSITVRVIPGNLEDSVTEFKVNNSIIAGKTGSNEFTYTINVKVKDVLGTNLTYTSNGNSSKDYVVSIITDRANSTPITNNAQATVSWSTYQHYFYLSGDSIPTTNSFNGAALGTGSTSKTSSVYSLGSEKKYLYLLSPHKVEQVETAAGETASGANSFSVTTAWQQREVQYTPKKGGTAQKYWLVYLETTQSKFVKIRIS